MDAIFSSFHVLVLTSCVFVFMILKLIASNSNKDNLPPGPWKFPLIGNLHLLDSVPHRAMSKLAKKHGPLMHMQLGEIRTIVVSSAEVAKQVLKTHELKFASRPFRFVIDIITYNTTDLAFHPYGEYWRYVRKICAGQLLNTAHVQSLRSIREEEVCKFIDWVASNADSEINLTEGVYEVTNSIISRIAIGLRHEDHQLLVKAVKDTLDLAAGFGIIDVFPSFERVIERITGLKSRINRVHEKADRLLQSIIDQRRKANTSSEIGEKNASLLDVFLKAQEDVDADVRLTDDNIKALLMDMYVAGSDTTTAVVVWAMSELIKSPLTMKKAQNEVREVFNRIGKVDETGIGDMKYLKAVIKETLRLHPSVALIPRKCREECEINGFKIPLQSTVLINLWDVGRDPKYWTEPDSFIPERFLHSSMDYRGGNLEYIPFGTGRRICVGMLFGTANIEHQLAMLLYHFDWKLPLGIKHQEFNMDEVSGLAVERKEKLSLIPISYRPRQLSSFK